MNHQAPSIGRRSDHTAGRYGFAPSGGSGSNTTDKTHLETRLRQAGRTEPLDFTHHPLFRPFGGRLGQPRNFSKKRRGAPSLSAMGFRRLEVDGWTLTIRIWRDAP
ncbi:hypothetical protein ABZ470_10040 [Streptosporangium sp. NPDC020072]|uniref:hypothetical protein n=1 Tax=Streptosporangium sp. NPDC020072 TaxID=3154788 RepID=UPI0034469C76